MNGAGAEPTRRFACTPGGAVRAGLRRLRWLLLGPAALMAATAVVSMAAGRWAVGLLCAAVMVVVFITWRMSCELLPLWVGATATRIVLRTRTTRPTLPLAEATARRLSAAERDHLQNLATTGGVVAPAGGFDSRLLGELELYASNLEHAVLVETPDDRWVVTPDEPDAFLLELKRLGGSNPATIHPS